jgi:hypothetical protein
MSPKIQISHHVPCFVGTVQLCFKVETAEDREVSGDEQGFCSMSIFLSLSESLSPSVGFLSFTDFRSRIRVYADVVRHFVNVRT